MKVKSYYGRWATFSPNGVSIYDVALSLEKKLEEYHAFISDICNQSTDEVGCYYTNKFIIETSREFIKKKKMEES